MGKVKERQQELDQQEIEEAAIRSANNHGAPKDMFVPGYGQILKDGKPTEAGIQFYKDHEDKLGNRKT